MFLIRSASCVMEDCKVDGRSAHRQGIRTLEGWRPASLVVGSFEAKTPIGRGASLSGKRDAALVGSKQLIGER
jgi:hypothetical protein